MKVKPDGSYWDGLSRSSVGKEGQPVPIWPVGVKNSKNEPSKRSRLDKIFKAPGIWKFIRFPGVINGQ